MRVSITIPRDVHLGENAKDEVVEGFCYMYGGATTQKAEGAWVDSTGKVVYNKVYKIETYTREWQTDDAEVGWEVYALAFHVKEILGEDTIMYTINDNAYFS